MVPVLDRYRPVALAATAVLVAVAVVPGATASGPPSFDSVSSFQDVASDEPEADDDEVAAVPPTSAPPNESTFSPNQAPAASAPSFSAPGGGGSNGSSGFNDSSGFNGSSGNTAPPPSSGNSDPSPAPSFDSDFGDPAGDETDGSDEPLQIVASAYASSTAGTPLPDDVPDGSLPVGTRVGQVDKASYIRLSGSGSSLVLSEIADGRRGGEFEAPPVRACQITEAGWEPSEDMTFADAPEHDPENCIDLLQQPDGTWQLSLAMFEDPTDDRGFALVPVEEPPLDFQIAFSTQTKA